MIYDEDFEWYKLLNVEGLGIKSLKTIWETGFPFDKIREMEESDFFSTFPGIRENVFNNLHKLDESALYQDYLKIKNEYIELIHLGGANYPQKLKDLSDFNIPLMFFAQGNLELLRSPGVAIVGARNASVQALEVAGKLAHEIADQGYNVISGYAKGIDTSAHLGAIEAGGSTILVLSYGILEFPNKRGFREEGWQNNILLLSQFPPTMKWNAGSAMRRNAFVCGLSQAVIVVEAGAEKDAQGRMSGTFSAGKTALNMNIPLYVVKPQELETAPAGNAELISLGGKGISASEGIGFIIQDIKESSDENSEKNLKIVTEQGHLF